MKIQEKLEQHPIKIIITLVVTVVGIVYAVLNYFHSEKLALLNGKYELKIEEQKRLEQEIVDLKKILAQQNQLDKEPAQLPQVGPSLQKAQKSSSKLNKIETSTPEDELNKQKQSLAIERARLAEELSSVNRRKIAQNYIDTYLREYSHVDLGSSKENDAQSSRDRRKAESLLDAIEAIARRISDDNEYLDFVARSRDGGRTTTVN